jgi:hypothetical protein
MKRYKIVLRSETFLDYMDSLDKAAKESKKFIENANIEDENWVEIVVIDDLTEIEVFKERKVK